MDSIVQNSCPELSGTFLGRYDPYRQDFLKQAEEICAFAQHIYSTRASTKGLGKDVNFADQDVPDKEVNYAGQDAKEDKRKCYTCGKVGHLANVCRKAKKDKDEANFRYLEELMRKGKAEVTKDVEKC